MNLEEKILALFELRMLPLLIKQANIGQIEEKRLLTRLKRLQQVIYELDAYLESTWTLEESRLNELWNPIFNALKGLHINPIQVEKQINYIKKYQKNEMELRENKLPTRFSFEYFYFYKSCDVKLLRGILYYKYPLLKQFASVNDWRYFDLITEVLDDVEDLFEDLHSINGNRFLIHLLKERDPDLTFNEFSDFIIEIKNKSLQKYGQYDSSEFRNQIHLMTLKSADETLELLQEQVHKFKTINFKDIVMSNFIPSLKLDDDVLIEN